MAKHLSTSYFYRSSLEPVSVSPDDKRREFTFNVLIALITGAALATLVSSVINHLVGNAPASTNSLPITSLFLAVSAGLWWLSRRGHYRPGAYLLTLLIWAAHLQLVLAWSFELPMAQLLAVLVIAVAGVLLSTREALICTLMVAITTLLLGYLQAQSILVPDTHWMTGNLELSDAIGLAVVFVIIGGVLWLSNKEIDSLFSQSKKYQAALRKERDQLEVTVAKRTQELERAQLERVLELQNLADFGRVSASLLHDLASPLTAAAINLEQAGSRPSRKLLEQAMLSVGHMEQYLVAARKQLQGTVVKEAFEVRSQLSEVVGLLSHQAAQAKVKLATIGDDTAIIYGNLADFHRVIANLIVNAIHSYQNKTSSKAEVSVQFSCNDNKAVIAITDHGVGISRVDIPHIFDDFYSTKKHVGRGLGLGLANAKRVIEDDLKGEIEVSSSAHRGTTFTIRIPMYEQANSTKHTRRHKLTGRQSK